MRGAWLKPVSGFCNAYEPNVLRKALVRDSEISALSYPGDEKHFVPLIYDGTVQIHDLSNLGTVLVIGNMGGRNAIAVAQQMLANGCSYVYAREVNGAVLCYEVSLDESGTFFAPSRAVGGTNSPVSYLFASKDGKVAAAVCEDGNVYVWELDGENSGSFEGKNTFFCSSAVMRKYGGLRVNGSAVVSGSGKFVAVGSSFEGLYVWREGKVSAERVGTGPTSLVSEDHRTRIFFVSLLCDETRLIVLFNETYVRLLGAIGNLKQSALLSRESGMRSEET